ncbi:MAG: hypothetical protein DI551_09440 [Micavibrio aeruginosavorus]|uniref:Response regulatory domain-containing protein n=1 Tax=Micavibrio aeruginosavorus TaxID=349221 RepID=A0A2W5N1S6_9BACT|nr:MAG: hypothetical protein DI551_09440 [Micavibrio aeruginosavorus]
MIQLNEISQSVLACGVDIPKVMLVEDDPVTRWMVRSALKDACILSIVSSSDNFMIKYKAVNQYLSFLPDMVLLDIDLTPADGKDLLLDIMLIDPDAYVVMFSAHNTEENIRKTIEHGAKGFITKPFEKNIIQQYIDDALLWKTKNF